MCTLPQSSFKIGNSFLYIDNQKGVVQALGIDKIVLCGKDY